MNRFDAVRKGMSAILVLGLVAAGSLGLTGCAGDDDAGTRNIVQITSVNGNLPLLSDLYNLGQDKEPDKTEDDFIPVDYIPVQFESRAHDPALTLRPDRAFGTVTFSRYTIDFTKNDLDGNGSEDIFDLDLPMNAIVPAGGLGTAAVLAVPASWKQTGALLHALQTNGEYYTDAKLTVYGEEETSHDKITLSAGFVVAFADYADQ